MIFPQKQAPLLEEFFLEVSSDDPCFQGSKSKPSSVSLVHEATVFWHSGFFVMCDVRQNHQKI
jgi:hypothetical protein